MISSSNCYIDSRTEEGYNQNASGFHLVRFLPDTDDSPGHGHIGCLKTSRMDAKQIIIFDGVCNLCTRSVKFIIKHDPAARFQFTAFQTKAGMKVLNQYGVKPKNVDTLLFIKGQRLFARSDAVLEIAKELEGPWKLLVVFKVLPKKIRDWLYALLAKNRYNIFGKQDHCLVPTDDIKARFLDND